MAKQSDAYLKSRFVTGAKPTQQDFHDFIDSKAGTDTANSSVDGLMSSADKSKLDEFQSANTYPTKADVQSDVDTINSNISNLQSDVSQLETDLNNIDVANSSISGLMSNTDKVKLDEFQPAANYVDMNYFARNNSMSTIERQNFMNVFKRQAEYDFSNSLEQLDYVGGSFDLFIDQEKIAEKEISIAGWDKSDYLSTASYDNVSFSVAGQDSHPHGITFSPDGTKMFIVGSTSDTVYSYTLGTAWDLSTASYDSISLSVSGQESQPTGIAFSPDGTKMFIVGRASDRVHSYTLGTAWDLSTASYDNISFRVASQDTNPFEITFSDDGTKMFMVGTSDAVYSYTLSTAWDLSTASYDSISFSVSGQDANPYGITFSPDGTRMFMVGSSESVYSYTLGIAWDLLTASYDNVSFVVGSQDSLPMGIAFSPDGNKMFMVGHLSDAVYSYTLLDFYAVTVKDSENLEFIFNSSFDTEILLNFKTERFTLDLAYDSISFSVSSQDSTPTGITFSTDGTKMFMVGVSSRSVYSYTLGTAWDLSTASYDSISFSFSSQDSAPTGIAFSTDGTKMFIVGSSDSVHSYTLGSAWDLSTASYDSVSFSVSGQDANRTGVAFSTDGTKMFIVGDSSNSVYSYTLGTAWDLSTASYDSISFSVAGRDTNPQEITFSPDGTRMFMVGQSSDAVYSYTLGTEWDLSTASYDNFSFRVNRQDSTPTGISFSTDGTKMFIVGDSSNSVYSYTLRNFIPGFSEIGVFGSTVIDVSDDFVVNPTRALLSPSVDVPSKSIFYVTIYNADDLTKKLDIPNKYFNKEVDISSLNAKRFKVRFWFLSNSDGLISPVLKNYSIFFDNANGGERIGYLVVDNFRNVEKITNETGIVRSDNGISLDYNPNAPWDVSAAIYDSFSFSVSEQDTNPQEIAFSSDGTKMFVLGTTSDSIYSYTLGSAWDLSTASYDSISFSVGSQDTIPQGITFSTDGTKMFMVGQSSGSVHSYTLGSAWDLSTASYDSISFSVSVQDAAPQGIAFSPDGTKMFMVGQSSDFVHSYTLGTAWDISTASYDSISFSVSGQDANPSEIAFSPDGTKMFMVGTVSNSVHSYTLGTAWNLSTASYDSISFSVSGQDATPTGITFSSDGTRMFMTGHLSDAVHSYTLSTDFNSSGSFEVVHDLENEFVSSPPSNVNVNIMSENGSLVPERFYDFEIAERLSDKFLFHTGTTPHDVKFSSDGLKVFFVDRTTRYVFSFRLSNAWDLSTSSYTGESFYISEDTALEGIAFSPDGTKMFIVGDSSDAVYSYTLGTAWDLSTASYDSISFSVSSQDSQPTGITFSSDGTKMFMVGLLSDSVHSYTLGTAWDLSTASYDSISFSVSGQDANPYGITFSPDGTKMFMIGVSSRSVYSYTLSTAWDISTASYDSISFSVSGQDSNPRGIAFSTDGTKMFMVGLTSDAVHSYTLSTAWDLSTASFISISLNVSSQDTAPQGITFSPDGTKMFIVGASSDSVHSYTLSTAWDLSTASYDSISFSVSSQDSSPQGIAFSTDGTKMFMVGLASSSVYSYTLGTAWNLSTASYDSISFSVVGQDTDPSGIAFSPDGTKMFMVGRVSDSVRSYTLGTAWDLSTASYDSISFSVSSQDTQPQGITFSPDGTRMFIVGRSSFSVHSYTLGTAWNLSTASYDNVSFSVLDQDTAPHEIAFSPDGTKMFMVGTTSDTVHSYTLLTAWNFLITSYDSISFSVSGQDSIPTGIAFSTDGIKMFMIGRSSDSVHSYTLGTAWNLSTASYDNVSFSIVGQDAIPTGITFSPDGTKMFMVGSTSDTVYSYTLSTAWDLSTASYDSISFSVVSQDTAPYGIAFSTDGTKMFIVGDSSDSVHSYTLGTAWNLSTASYDNVSFSVSGQDTQPEGITFSPDGTKMFMVGRSSDSVHSYTLSTAWDLSTASYDNISISGLDSTPSDVVFDSTGQKMFVLGQSSRLVQTYDTYHRQINNDISLTISDGTNQVNIPYSSFDTDISLASLTTYPLTIEFTLTTDETTITPAILPVLNKYEINFFD